MAATLTMHTPYRRADGHIGAHARLLVDHPSGWHQTYTFDTHGMSPTDVADKAAAIERYHAAKCDALVRFRDVQGALVDGFRVVDCTIFDAEVTLYLDVRDVDGRAVRGFPLRLKYLLVERIPSNDAILQIVRSALPAPDSEIQAAHEAFVASVNEKMGR